mgnify:CR=1 FL=1
MLTTEVTEIDKMVIRPLLVKLHQNGWEEAESGKDYIPVYRDEWLTIIRCLTKCLE